MGFIKKIDKYIISKYLSTFFFVVMIFTMIAIVIDFSAKVEEFIEKDCTISEIIFDYYINFVIYINGELWPLFAMISVIFITSRLASNSEIISILNSGASYTRLLRPYLIGAGIITLLLLIGEHFVIPYANQGRLAFERAYVWTHSDQGKTRDVHLFVGPEEKVYVRFYRKRDTTVQDLQVERFDNKRPIYRMKAKRAEWLGYPNRWKLQNYEIRTFDGDKETLVRGEKGASIDTTVNLIPEDFVRYADESSEMTTPTLLKAMETERTRGTGNVRSYKIDLYKRTADPITIIILTLMGVAVASRKVRGGMGLHLAIGLGLGAVFIFMAQFSKTFAATDDLNPFLGVWLPNLFFICITAYLLMKAQK